MTKYPTRSVSRTSQVFGMLLLAAGALALFMALISGVEWHTNCRAFNVPEYCNDYSAIGLALTWLASAVALSTIGMWMATRNRASRNSIVSFFRALLMGVGFGLLALAFSNWVSYNANSGSRSTDIALKMYWYAGAGVGIIIVASLLGRMKSRSSSSSQFESPKPVSSRPQQVTPAPQELITIRGRARRVNWADLSTGQALSSTTDPTIPLPYLYVGSFSEAHAQNKYITKLGFRLELDDGSPNPGKLVPVEAALEAADSSVHRSINEAEEIEMLGWYGPSGTFYPVEIHNLSTGQAIRGNFAGPVQPKAGTGFSVAHIQYLERTYLDSDAAKGIRLSAADFSLPPIENMTLLRVKALAVPSNDDRLRESALPTAMANLLSSLNECGAPFVFVITGRERSEVAVYIGALPTPPSLVSVPQLVNLEQLLRGAFPGIEVEVLDAREFRSVRDTIAAMPYSSIVTGTPSLKDESRLAGLDQIEQVIRGMQGTQWAYILTAYPLRREEVESLFSSVLREQNDVKDAQVRLGIDNYTGTTYTAMLSHLAAKLDQGKANGMWHAAAWVATLRPEEIIRLMQLAKMAFGGADSRPDTIRTLRADGIGQYVSAFAQLSISAPKSLGGVQYKYRYASLLHSGELTALAHLPAREFPGYVIKLQPYYGTQSPATRPGRDTLRLGEIQLLGRPSGRDYTFEVDTFARHALISGLPGSGKTNTTLQILIQLWAAGCPFLVIESAEKNEYRQLLDVTSLKDDLRVFSLGNASIAPLHINPLYVMPGIRLNDHISRIGELIINSIGIWSPLPELIQDCLREVYRDRGWIMGAERDFNTRGDHPNTYPTLSDLYRKIRPMVAATQYDPQIKDRLVGALETRLGSLLQGSKGALLDTRETISINDLLAKPTVLELSGLGSDDDRAFISGVILILLYEHLRTRPQNESGKLQHVTVVEEAHRLLTEVQLYADSERGNAKGVMVNLFVSMMAEIRSAGEGLIIVEQNPSKLARDVAKLASLKILHCTVSFEDRAYLGAMMNMNDAQSLHAATLQSGSAIVFGIGDDKPVNVQVSSIPLLPSRTRAASDEFVRNTMHARLVMQSHGIAVAKVNRLRQPGEYKMEIVEIVQKAEFRQAVSRFMLTILASPGMLVSEFADLRELVHKFDYRRINTDDFICRTILYAIDTHLDTLGKEYGWHYAEMDKVENLLLRSLCAADVVPQEFDEIPIESMSITVDQWLQQLRQAYYDLCILQRLPFSRCTKVCRDKICLYHYANRSLLDDPKLKVLDVIRGKIARGTVVNDPAAYWGPIAEQLVQYVKLVTHSNQWHAQKTSALCLGVQAIERMEGEGLEARDKFVIQLVYHFAHLENE